MEESGNRFFFDEQHKNSEKNNYFSFVKTKRVTSKLVVRDDFEK